MPVINGSCAEYIVPLRCCTGIGGLLHFEDTMFYPNTPDGVSILTREATIELQVTTINSGEGRERTMGPRGP